MSTPTDGISLTLAEVKTLTRDALRASGVSDANLGPLVASVVAAEADGIHSHGLARLPTYCEHARCGKIDGKATPVLDRPRPGLVRVDARDGFAHPAIELGLPALIEAAKAQGIAALAVTNSYNCGVVGHHVQRIAEAGLLALGFVNAPASMAPAGGTRPVFGTNPVAFAAPRGDAPPLVLDQSASVVAKSELVVHQQRGEPIPLGWAIDKDGNPTTDPAAASPAAWCPPVATRAPARR
jgi:(2R)-3-sulfolactate dehydrogenase (NADP+)